MLGRRAVIGAALANVGASAAAQTPEPQQALPIPPGGNLGFRIMRHGSKIGEHQSSFSLAGDALTMHADVEIVVRLIGIPLFRFTHQVVERWTADRFISIATQTNDDGTPYWVRAERKGAGFSVTGSAITPYTAPPETLPMTHWNRAELGVPKLNPQKGDLLRPVVSDRGMTQVPAASGTTIPARRWNFSGQATLDVWFDTGGFWAALAFLGSDQSQITLERL